VEPEEKTLIRSERLDYELEMFSPILFLFMGFIDTMSSTF